MVLVVDDNEENIDILIDALGEDYNVRVAMDGEEALESVAAAAPDIMLLDIMMPRLDGYEVCRRIKADPATASIPIILLTAINDVASKTRGFEMGAVDYVTKPFHAMEVKVRVHTHLSLVAATKKLEAQNDILEHKVLERTRKLKLTQEATIQTMALLAECRDPETGGHIKRTQNYVRLLARELAKKPKFANQLDDSTIEIMQASAPLHDVGKVGVPDSILLKPGKLTDEEFNQMKQHTVYAERAFSQAEALLGRNSFLSTAREIAYSHHEKWNGEGYPEGLSGTDIPLAGRIMALADVYDALISRRVYKEPFPHHKVVTIILKNKGTHFDPDIVDAFMNVQEDFRRTAMKHADFEDEKKALSQPYQT